MTLDFNSTIKKEQKDHIIEYEPNNLKNTLGDQVSMDDISDRAGYIRNNSFHTNLRSTPKFKPQFSRESFPSVQDGP